MTGDRMIIKKRSKDVLLVDEQNQVHDLNPCPYAKDYDGLDKPKCNCQPCWNLWTEKQSSGDLGQAS